MYRCSLPENSSKNAALDVFAKITGKYLRDLFFKNLKDFLQNICEQLLINVEAE